MQPSCEWRWRAARMALSRVDPTRSGKTNYYLLSQLHCRTSLPTSCWKRTADIVSIFSDIWKLGPETPRLLHYLRASLRLLPGLFNAQILRTSESKMSQVEGD